MKRLTSHRCRPGICCLRNRPFGERENYQCRILLESVGYKEGIVIYKSQEAALEIAEAGVCYGVGLYKLLAAERNLSDESE